MTAHDESAGPRGGTTTRKRGQVQKTIWFYEDEAEAIRNTAFEERTSEAALVRTAVRTYLKLPTPEE